MLKNFLLFGSFILLSSNAYSKTNFYQVTGSISSVEVLKTYSTQKVPRNEKRCSIQRVPVNQDANKFGADNLNNIFHMGEHSAKTTKKSTMIVESHMEMIHKERKYLASTIEILALYVDLIERKVAEFEDEKIKIMDDFITKNKSKFKNENLKFSTKLKKWKLN